LHLLLLSSCQLSQLLFNFILTSPACRKTGWFRFVRSMFTVKLILGLACASAFDDGYVFELAVGVILQS
jgi:hypothetical protein